jgi:hypothetical protein
MFDSSTQLRSDVARVWFFVIFSYYSNGCFFKFGVGVGVEESIVNAPPDYNSNQLFKSNLTFCVVLRRVVDQLFKCNFIFFLFDTVRIWEFSPVWTDFDEFDNLSKRNVKLILKIFSHLEPLRGLVEQKNVVFNSFLCNLRS